MYRSIVDRNENTICWMVYSLDNMRVFAVSGYSGSGKTTVVEAIVRALYVRGISVITVKSSKHDVKDEEGTDTWRYRMAGARNTIILGPRSSIVHYGERKSLKELVQGMEADYLIIEGMKSSDIPKFWCIGNLDIETKTQSRSVKAIVTLKALDGNKHLEVPVISAEQVDRLVAIIEREAIDISELDF